MQAPASFKPLAFLGLAVAVALLAACGNHGPQQESPAPATPASTAAPAPTPPAPATPMTVASTPASGTPCPNPPPCKSGHDCSNYPFAPTDCWTTEYGPAKADVILAAKSAGPVSSTNMLYCDGGAYALCFFSGPPFPTGTSYDNKALPCVVNGEDANCKCRVYTSGAYFVDINSILNRGAYFETVDRCGQDGSKCANIATCGPDGTKSGCPSDHQAPVCKYVRTRARRIPKAR